MYLRVHGCMICLCKGYFQNMKFDKFRVLLFRFYFFYGIRWFIQVCTIHANSYLHRSKLDDFTLFITTCSSCKFYSITHFHWCTITVCMMDLRVVVI
jgi:hypothetical protein